MNKTLLIIGFFLQFSLKLNGQEKISLCYNFDWEITDKSKAAYFREAEYDLGTMKLDGKVIDHNRFGELIMEGDYSNGKKNREFVFYNRNRKIERKGNYSDNQRIGKWEYYYSNGQLKQIVFFSDGNWKADFAVLEYWDKNGNQMIKDGTGSWINDSIKTGLFDGSSLKRHTGYFKDSLKDGDWKLVRLSDNKFMHSEKFRKGKFIEGQVYTPRSDDVGYIKNEMISKIPDEYQYKFKNTERFALDNTVFSQSLLNSDVETIFKEVTGKEFKIMNRRAMYPQGDFGLLEFISQQIRYPLSAQLDGIKGTVFVSIVIDSLGNKRELKILRGIREDLNNEASRVLSLINKWLPSIRDGKAIESTITIPVKFELKN